MTELLQQVAVGIASGGIYSSVALALVMIFRSTGHVNFAQGEMAMLSTFLAWALIEGGMSYWAAVPITVAAAFVGGVAIEWALIRPVRHGRELSLVTVFLGLLMICNSLAGWVWGYELKQFPSPFDGIAFLKNAYASPHDIGVFGVTVLVMSALFALFHYTLWGLGLRASADNPASSWLVGIPVGRMSGIGWGLASAIGAIAGVMVAPTVFLDPTMMLNVLLYGFAAALLGGINNPWGAVAGGFIIGVLENLLGVYVIGTEIRMSVALMVIVAVLVVRPAGLFGTRTVVRY